MPKIIYQREKCIGCGSCVVLCPKYWELDEEGKAILKNSKINPEKDSQELETAQIDCAKEAADACPVQAIHIT